MKKVFCALLSGLPYRDPYISPKSCTPTKHKLCLTCNNKGRSAQKRSASKSRKISSMFGDADRFSDNALIYLSLFQGKDLNADERKALGDLEEYFNSTADNIIQDFQNRCDQGKNEMVPIVVEALGEYAFDQTWFIDGLKVLHQKRVEAQIPGAKPERWVDYTSEFEWGRKLEAKAKKEPIRNIIKLNPKDSKYYKEKPKSDAIYIHYAFGCSRPELRLQVIEAVEQTKGSEFLAKIRKIFNNLLP